MPRNHAGFAPRAAAGLREWLAETRESDARKALAPLIVEAERAGVSSTVLEPYKRHAPGPDIG